MPSEFEEVVFIPAKPAELDPFDVLRAVEAECDRRVKDEKRASGVQEYARPVTVFFEGGTCTERTVAEASAEMAKIHAKPRFYVYGLRQFGGVLAIDAVYWVNRAEPGVEVTVKGIDRPVVYGMARTLSEAAKHASPSSPSAVQAPPPEEAVTPAAPPPAATQIVPPAAASAAEPRESKAHAILTNPGVALLVIPILLLILGAVINEMF